jgi:DnaJ-class molecular chaperone
LLPWAVGTDVVSLYGPSDREITHLDGKNITLTNTSEVTPISDTIWLHEKGMPVSVREDLWGSLQPTRYGNLYVNVKVKLPTKLKDKTKKKLREIFQA